MNQTIQNQTTLNNNTVLLKKMRLLKKLSRKQAGILFNVSHKTIEKLENGRGNISEDKLMRFAFYKNASQKE